MSERADKPAAGITIRSAVFIKAAVKPQHYPDSDLPEVAFAGRSNVGKSSLINCILQRRKLVRTSRTPGRTQTINFFGINDAFVFVDLPGYGYARVPNKIRETWGPMVEQYLDRREVLRGVVQIMDARRPPTPDDLQLWAWLRDACLPAIAVLTKIDKVKRAKRDRSLQGAAIALGIDPSELVPFSAVTRSGRHLLWQRLAPWIT